MSLGKVSKGAKIRNRYNQVPHLTQDTNGKDYFGAHVGAHTFKMPLIVYNCITYTPIVKRLLIPVLQIRVCNVKLFCYFSTKNLCCG